jgi:hypothetical protein
VAGGIPDSTSRDSRGGGGGPSGAYARYAPDGVPSSPDGGQSRNRFGPFGRSDGFGRLRADYFSAIRSKRIRPSSNMARPSIFVLRPWTAAAKDFS